MMRGKNDVTKHDLAIGTRFTLTDESSFLRITSGTCEVYARNEKKCQQMFLMEMGAGTIIFPALDEFGDISIFIYAVTEVRMEICPFDTNIPLAVLSKAMNEWFSHLVEVPFLKFFADRGDDMLMLWKKADFLLNISTSTALWNTFVEHEQIFSLLLGMRFIADDKKNAQRMEQRESYKKRLLGTAVKHLLQEDDGLDANEVIVDQMIGEALYIVRHIASSLSMTTRDIQLAPELVKKLDQLTLIRRLMQKAGIQMRLIALEKDWYKSDCGTILGYWGAKKELAALVPTSPSTYKMVTKQCPEGQPLTAELAKKLDQDAFVCYAGFPARRLSIKDVLTFMFKQCWRQDYQTIIMTSVVAGLIPLFTPIITETIFSDIIPTLDRQSLATVTQVMMVTGFTTAAISIVRSIAVMRITNHLDMATEAALWSRLLSLPAKFFRRFQTGELLNRMHGIEAVKSLVTGEFVGAVFNFVFSFWSLLLMAYYSVKLTAEALVVWVVYFIVVALIYRRVISFQRKKIEAGNKVAGQVQQIFVGLPKFRVQGAEEQAFYLWSKVFGEEWKWNLRLRWQNNYNAIIGSVQPFILTMLLYYTVMYGMNETTPTGKVVRTMSYAQFLGFQAAFSAFNATMISVIPLVAQIFGTKPHIDNLRPILEEEPEITEDKIDSEVLAGGLEVSHLTFAYHDTQDVIKDVSFKVAVGEKIAIVGRSGCGKSTLMRLLLGFEQPKNGAIYYDNQDLAELNLSSVRSQLGVVLQNGQLMTGDIFTNIVGTTTLTMDDAWEAAGKVGMANDIREMPMGMYTVISEGSGNISGGQRQRLLIARAIVNRPAIIILDEATSALDNRTQAIVTDSLKKMNCTQIIVAHRLTTIRDADRILVMDKGQIVETGTYDELIVQGGIFASLASRQVV